MNETAFSIKPEHRMRRVDHTCMVVSFLAAVMASVVGAAVLLGWTLDLPLLKGGFNSGITVKTNAGVCFLLTGISLGLRVMTRDRPKGSKLGAWLALIVAAIGTLTLSQHAVGWNLGIDQFLFAEPPSLRATASPNRMGPPASVCFMFSGIALFLLNKRTNVLGRFEEVASRFAIAMCLIGGLSTLGYLFGADQLYGMARITGIALISAITFVALGMGIICASANGQIISLLSAENAGGVLLRRMLLPSIVLPPLFGYLRTAGESAGLYTAPFGRSLLVLSFIVCFTGLVWWSSKILARTDRARQGAERERENLLNAERWARSEAERVNHVKDEFLATLSHELRTPLTAILGWSQLLRSAPPGGDMMKRGVDTIERNARAQRRLIEDLLDMSRIISGKLRLNVQRIAPSSFVQAAIDTVRPAADAKGVELVADLDKNIESVSGDADRLQQLAWNLLSNAIKFTPKDGRVRITLKQVDSHLEIVVADTGQGIAPEFMPFIFDRFRQADASTTRKTGGLGLGLAISKKLVELHGGSLRVASDGEGRGATFTAQLPLNAISPEADEKIEEPARPAPANGDTAQYEHVDLHGITLLVVDDDTDVRDIIKRILTDRGASVVAAGSGNEALEFLRNSRPNLLISDIGMPEMDGFEFIRLARSTGESNGNGHIPAIALTAFARGEDRGRAIAAGYAMHVSKPVESIDLLMAVAKLAGRVPAPASSPN